MTTVGEIAAAIEALAPPSLAEPWDRVGLQLGRESAPVEKALICLGANEWIVGQARELGCALIITHHPLFFGDIRSLTGGTAVGRAALRAVESGIAVYAAHTNLDKAAGGLNDALASLLGLTNVEVLETKETLYKLVVFVPGEALEAVKHALGDAGAGVIGLYSHCSFAIPGKGSFRPLAGSKPAVGKKGADNTVDEYRLEVEVGAADLAAARAAMIAAHPYEEVAYDIFELVGPDRKHGLGRVGDLETVLTLDRFAARCGELFGSDLRIAGEATEVRRAAVCGGSGASLIGAAKAAGADVFVTGDIKYHDACGAADLDMAVIDAGHEGTERAALRVWSESLRRVLDVELVEAAPEGPVWRRPAG